MLSSGSVRPNPDRDHNPTPAAFTARTCTSYRVSAERPEIVVDVATPLNRMRQPPTTRLSVSHAAAQPKPSTANPPAPITGIAQRTTNTLQPSTPSAGAIDGGINAAGTSDAGNTSGGGVKAAATAALEACSGVVARAFAACEISDPPEVTAPLTPNLMAMIGRALIRRGEIALVIDVDGAGMLHLWPAASWDLTGSYNPESWLYRLHLAGPSQQHSIELRPSEGVVHLCYSRDPARPRKGVGPIEPAALAGRLSAETAAALGDESSMSRGAVLPLPVDGNDPTVAQLKADLRKLSGSLALVESTADQWGTGDTRTAPRKDWEPRRIGANPPAPLVQLHEAASREVLSAVGISPSLFSGGDGTSMRESWRQVLFGVIAPLGRIVQDELQAKLEAEITISWEELRASDLSGRARTFQSMIGGGMEVERAASLAGLMDGE